MARLYKADGQNHTVTPRNGTDFQLDELYELVGNPIDIVRLRPGNLLMVVHDEGLILGLPRNERASALYGETIAGDVLLCSKGEVR